LGRISSGIRTRFHLSDPGSGVYEGGGHITVLLRQYRIQNGFRKKSNKSLSNHNRFVPGFAHRVYPVNICAKALQYVCRKGSFTVEAAFVLPLFLFAAVVVLDMFPMLMIQTQVNAGLQYTARILAVSCQDPDTDEMLISFAEGQVLFRTYMNEHGYEESVLENGLGSISLLSSDLEGDYVTLTASYEAKLPVSFWTLDALPVRQSVKMKKWTGAAQDGDDEDDTYVYITPTGSAYHKTAECSYLKLSIRSVSVAQLGSLRNKSGGIYYACSCYDGGSLVYITDYGTQYHGDLNCSGLKRTVYKVSIDNVGDRHACSKCCAGE